MRRKQESGVLTVHAADTISRLTAQVGRGTLVRVCH
jgi:hypothetical protein